MRKRQVHGRTYGLAAVVTVGCVTAMALTLGTGAAGMGQGATPIAPHAGDLAARVAALETRVADLQAGTAPLATPVAAASPAPASGSPAAAGASAVYGNAREFLGPGTPGELSVVASGLLRGASIAVVVRNNTDRTVAHVEVGAEVRDGGGTLVASGSSPQFQPNVVPPGELAIGSVTFAGAGLPEGAMAIFDVSASDDVGLYSSFGPVTVELVEFVARPDAILGTFRNPTGTPIVGEVYFSLACFGEDGTLLAQEPGRADRTDLAPGETTAFHAWGIGIVPPCGRFLITGYGNSK